MKKNIYNKFKNILVDNYSAYFSVVFLLALSFVAIFLFLKRVIYPDVAFDTINYHFFLGKNGFDNFPFSFKSNEFYPLGMHSFNPIIDIINYVGYLLLGYKLGTIGSLISTLGTIILGVVILNKIINKEYSNKNKLFFIVPFLAIPFFIVNESLFQIGTYFTDNIFVFFLMSYLFVLIKLVDCIKEEYKFFYMNIFAGILIGLIMSKLTNIIYIVPFLIINIYIIYKKYIKNNKKEINKFILILLTLGLCILSVNYVEIINFIKSGNPVFPYYNKIFHSIYYSETSWHFNFGPTSLKEKLFYPYYSVKNPKILGEVKDIFPDLKLIFEFFYIVVAWIFFYIKKEKLSKYEKVLIWLFIASFILWQVQFGYSRYGIFLEILGGMASILFIVKIFSKIKSDYFIKTVTIIYLTYIFFQAGNILIFNYKHDISWRATPTIINWKDEFFSKNIFNKYTIITKEEEDEIRDADVVVQCTNPSSAYFSTIKVLKDKPMINIDKGSNYELTTDSDYIMMRDNLVAKRLNRDYLKFVIVFNEKGGPDSGISRGRCLEAIKKENIGENKIKITKELSVNNFIGDKNFKLTVLLGEYRFDK